MHSIAAITRYHIVHKLFIRNVLDNHMYLLCTCATCPSVLRRVRLTSKQVRGYSVVIGAVEAAITEHPLVSTAIVMTEGEEGSMDKKLVAYIVPDSWEKVRLTALSLYCQRCRCC